MEFDVDVVIAMMSVFVVVVCVNTACGLVCGGVVLVSGVAVDGVRVCVK